MKESTFLKAHTIKEVSKIIQVPTGTIRQWEKDLNGLLNIPRTKQGARYYTETEISLLSKIKKMREKNLGKELICELIEKHLKQMTFNETSEFSGTELSPIIEIQSDNPTNTPALDIYTFMETYKDNLLNEVRNELRNGVRKEFVEEVRKEISKGTLQTVKSLSDSIYKSTEKTKDEIMSLSNQLAKSSERTSEKIGTLSHNIAKSSEQTSKKMKSLESKIARTSIHTSETIEALSNNIVKASEHTYETIETLTNSIVKASEHTSETVDSLSDSIEAVSQHTYETVEALSSSIAKATEYTSSRVKHLETNMARISGEILESINTDRDYYIETINHVHDTICKEISHREEVFKNLVVSFRDAATSKDLPKKWWAIWK